MAILVQMAFGFAAPAVAAYFTFSSAERSATWLSWLAAGTAVLLATLFIYILVLG